MLNSDMEWACVCVAQSCWLASILSNALEAGNTAGPTGLVVHQACGFSLWLSLSLRTVLSLPMPWLWFLPTLHRMAIVISAIWLAPLPAAGAGVPEPGGLVISETVVSFPQHQGLAHTQHRSPSDSAHRGRVAMVTLLLTVSRETAPWSWSYFAGLAEAGTEGWEDSRKDGRWGMRAACGYFPSGSICVCVCVHTRLLTLALHRC